MLKRIIALILCAATCLSLCVGLVSCNSKKNEDKGQSVIMYLPDVIYDLDPAHAFNNKNTASIVGLMFETLFKLNENGKVKKGLVKDYKIIEDESIGEYKLELELKQTYWSDGVLLSANDVLWAWQRLLDVEASYDAAALLFDIKNARAVKTGDASPDDLGVTADNNVVTITFEGKIDYDQFMYNLTSIALAPLREDIANKGDDWAKKPSTMVTSGPFKLGRITFTDPRYADRNVKYEDPIYCPDDDHNYREKIISSFIIERNPYYFRESEKNQRLDKSVTPYRIIVDCSLDDEDILAGYNEGAILYMGDIPYSLRNEFSKVKVADALSTHTFMFNQNALIENKSTGEMESLFANKAVRQALSLALDREWIAEEIVYGKVAEGLVPHGATTHIKAKKTFRETYTNNAYLTYDLAAAKKLLKNADIDASDYEFAIQVPAYDDRQIAIAQIAATCWGDLGFKVTVEKVGTIENNDHYLYTDLCHTDMCDDIYAENLRYGRFEVISLDLCATSADVFSILAPFAKAFSGQAIDISGNDDEYELTPHISGYDSEEYNALMEEIFNEKTIKNRADNYARAEEILMEDLPVIPTVHNESATLVSKSINWHDHFLFFKTKSTYYDDHVFNKLTVKSYKKYIKNLKSFMNEERYLYYSSIENKYLYSFKDFTYEEFQAEVTIYDFIFN